MSTPPISSTHHSGRYSHQANNDDNQFICQCRRDRDTKLSFLKKIISSLSSSTTGGIPPKPMITRSPHWKEIREQAIKNSGGKCAACGLKTNLKVHHIIPLH